MNRVIMLAGGSILVAVVVLILKSLAYLMTGSVERGDGDCRVYRHPLECQASGRGASLWTSQGGVFFSGSRRRAHCHRGDCYSSGSLLRLPLAPAAGCSLAWTCGQCRRIGHQRRMGLGTDPPGA